MPYLLQAARTGQLQKTAQKIIHNTVSLPEGVTVDPIAYTHQQPLCEACHSTQCSLPSANGRGRQRAQRYWTKCNRCPQWYDVSNAEQRHTVADNPVELPHFHECTCTACLEFRRPSGNQKQSTKGKDVDRLQLMPKPSLKGPVPTEIMEKAFADILPTLQEELRVKHLFEKHECTPEALDVAIQASRKHFIERVQKYGDGCWGKATIIKQYRRRKWWYVQDSEHATHSGLSI